MCEAYAVCFDETQGGAEAAAAAWQPDGESVRVLKVAVMVFRPCHPENVVWTLIPWTYLT